MPELNIPVFDCPGRGVISSDLPVAEPEVHNFPMLPLEMIRDISVCPRRAYLARVTGLWGEDRERFAWSVGNRPSHAELTPPTRQGFVSGTSPFRRSSHWRNVFPLRRTRRPKLSELFPPNQATTQATPEASPQATPDASPEAHHTLHTRDLNLRWDAIRLFAKVQIVEPDGDHATPVLYLPGFAPPKPKAWHLSPDAVHLCGQALFLRQVGFTCHSGILCYRGDQQQVKIVFSQPLLDHTNRLLERVHLLGYDGGIPQPLDDRSDCPSCPLLARCLPEETAALRLWATHDDTDPVDPRFAACGITRIPPRLSVSLPLDRELWSLRLDHEPDPNLPARTAQLAATLDQSTSLHFYWNQYPAFEVGPLMRGERTEVTLGAFRLLEPYDDDFRRRNPDISWEAHQLLTIGLPIVRENFGGFVMQARMWLDRAHFPVRAKQLAAVHNVPFRFQLAQALLIGKLKNRQALLRRHIPEQAADSEPSWASWRARAEGARSVDSLLEVDDEATREYFRQYYGLLPGQPRSDGAGLRHRPAGDRVTAALGFVYGLVTMELSAALAQLGLDPQLGFWHAPRHRRPSLALDLLEEFQPALGEETVLAAFQQGQLTDAAFTAGETGITLTKAGCRVLSSHLYNRLRQPAPSNNGGSQRQYKQLLHRQAEVLASHLLEDSTTYKCHEDE